MGLPFFFFFFSLWRFSPQLNPPKQTFFDLPFAGNSISKVFLDSIDWESKFTVLDTETLISGGFYFCILILIT